LHREERGGREEEMRGKKERAGERREFVPLP